MPRKVILNIRIADQLLKAGFVPVEFTPSNKLKGRAAFIFENTAEFSKALERITNK